jgi:aspartokinase
MDRVIAIVRDHLARSAPPTPPVVVVSAMSKVTDRLIESARLAAEGSGEDAAKLLNDLLERHAGVGRRRLARSPSPWSRGCRQTR